ncbi:MAG: glycosyltransferase [Lachnospiraceae bacterium]|nr:glycosyltransferase [Lachnospiraceae bacterium]
MKKILHMTPPEVSNGVYRYIFNHMPFIDQREYEFSFLTKSADELRDSKEYERYHFPIYHLKNVQRDGRQAFEKEIRSILANGFDAVHLHTSSWRGFLIEEIAMDMGIPKVIVHSHSSGIDFCDEAERERIWNDHTYYKECFTMQYATDVCACSQLAADWLFNSRIPREMIRIMPNAVDVKKFRLNRKVREQMRKELGVEERVVVGNVGRYSYTKNQEFLVRAFTKAYKRNKQLFLIMIGEGERAEDIRRLVAQLDMTEHIRCFGWSDRIPAYLQAMDGFCLPSKFEGLPISVVEAQAAGLKCLVSDTVTRETDLTGLVTFLPLEEHKWVEGMSGLKADKDREWMDEAFGKAAYSIEASSQKLMKLYDS